MPQNLMRLVRLFQLLDFLIGKLNIQRAQGFVQMI